MSVLAFSTPVATDRWWHIKSRTPAGVSRWASPRWQDDCLSSPPPGETLVQRSGAVRIGDSSPGDPLGAAVAVAFHPSGDRLAYVADIDGTERSELRVRSVGDPTRDEIVARSISHSVCWGVGTCEDDLYFCRVDDTLRPYAVTRLSAAGITEDVVIEDDTATSVRVNKCSSSDHLVVHSTSMHSTVVHAIDGTGAVHKFAGLDESFSMWHVDTVRAADGSSHWIALTDSGKPQNFHIRTAVGAPSNTVWSSLYEPRAGDIRALYARGAYALVEEVGPEGERYVALRSDGSATVVANTDEWQGRPARYVLDLASVDDTVSFTVSTPIDPPFLVDFRLGGVTDVNGGTGASRVVTRSIPTALPEPYEMMSIDTLASDGYTVPITVMRRIGAAPHSPCVVEVYGAYGVELGRRFDPTVIALLDAGVVVALAHVRGGSERGSGWHALGTGVGKEDTIQDYLACLTEVGRHKWVDPHRVAAWGTSAGGTIVAAAINMAPHLMHAAALDVPFVDPLETLGDDAAPLALRDRPEWGDPSRDAAIHDAMQRYSPLHNARPGPHPKLRVTAGQNDPRAPLRDIERWLERLRPAEVDLVITDGGHGGDRPDTVRWLTEILAPAKAGCTETTKETDSMRRAS